ncbi:DUF6049 family protein [Streptomyces sp. NBC_01387]|uniref:DUF6049 family protein n=1 Tax=unclassified Streptomyces TaxID=2593676 RepID=UPI002024A890|nr:MULTISPECIES: DUF6049 family protein [unclassified Streptomyces]MCX4549542.1 DUF6049 family protein [Streptomyces sp. NBC_01500]WSC21079.1 DUF6049 family protein [Streptomyces sp. NBC_01766]
MAEAAHFQEMTPSPARRWLRRSASLLAGGTLMAGLFCGPAAAPAQAAVATTGTGDVAVSLDALTPSAPVKGDTVTISGTVTNKRKETITDAHVGVRVGPRLVGRSAIDDAAKHASDLTGNDPLEIGDKYTTKFAKLPAGISEDFSISVPVSKLDLGADGVYQLGVSLTGQTANAGYQQMLGIQRTFLPWQPTALDKKTQVTTVWPLISKVHLRSETGSDAQQTPVFENDELAEELAPGGRLEQMVSLGRSLPVTWVIDPDLLAGVDAMTRNYQIKVGNTEVAGKNQAVAKKWLSELEDAVQGQQVVALPFADPDLASLAHRGKNVPGALSHLQSATEIAATTVQTILHVKPSTDFAWPADGAIDPSIVDVATSAGAHNVIASSDSMEETAGLPYTPTAARPIGGGTTAVVSDARLSNAFQGDMTEAGSSTLAVQNFLAQSLALTLQDTSKQRSTVIAPQRMPSTSQAQSMASALRALDAQRWTQPLNLVEASKAKADPDATTTVPSASAYPNSLRRQELPTQAFQDVRTTQTTLDNFKIILTQPDRVVTPFSNAIDRSMATSWRGDAKGARTYRDEVQDYLLSLTGQVQIVQKSAMTLSGRSATIPVTVQNKLLQPTQHLVLQLRSTSPTRLQLGNDKAAIAEQPLKIAGGHSQTVKFTTSINANGPVQVYAQLFTEDGTPYGTAKAMPFTVTVSEMTPTVMLVIAGGVLLLVLAGIKMYTHRKRTAARAAGTGDDDPEQPSDPAADTGAESGNPPGTGEKVDR